MIVPMEKITALVFHKAKSEFLSSLQKLGVIHIALEKSDISDESIIGMGKRIERIKTFIRESKKHKPKPQSKQKSQTFIPEVDAAFFYVELYEKTKEELSEINDRIQKTEREMRNISEWGEFDIEVIKKLREAGVNTRFFIATTKKFKKLDLNKINFQEVERSASYVYFVVFETKEKVSLDCEEFIFPDTDLRQLKYSYGVLRQIQRDREHVLDKLFDYTQKVESYLGVLETSYSYASISNNVEAAVENSIYIVKGWMPCNKRKRVEEFLEKQEAYFYFTKPEVDEKVPVLLKNNRFARLFEPITKLFDLPSYAEMDLTAFFAPFFTLFFGFCLGDAGYGLVILLLALFFRRKLPDAKKPIASLLAILGTSTFFCGLVTGTLFGADLSAIHGIEKIVLFNQDKLFNAALILGIIQVLFGMGLKATNRIRQYGAIAAVSTFGWMILLVGIIGLMISKTSIWLVYCGIAMILFFNDIKANIFVRIGKGLWELYGITGVFGDVLSYIRLFALGISSSILGFVVNEIAFQAKGIPVVGFIVTFLILVIGHTGNLLLSALSSFVHPLRLTFVEFYKSAGFKGGSKAYSPFRKLG